MTIKGYLGPILTQICWGGRGLLRTYSNPDLLGVGDGLGGYWGPILNKITQNPLGVCGCWCCYWGPILSQIWGGVLRPYSYPDPRRISMDRNHTHKVIRTNETVKFKQSMKLSPLNLLLESNSFCHKVKGQGHISTCYLLWVCQFYSFLVFSIELS